MTKEDVINIRITNLEKRTDKMEESLENIKKGQVTLRINLAKMGTILAGIQVLATGVILYAFKLAMAG